MGTSGYVVDIDSITLEPQADKDVGIEKDKQLTFSDARVRITQDKAIKTCGALPLFPESVCHNRLAESIYPPRAYGTHLITLTFTERGDGTRFRICMLAS
jgi:hypothetical protein